MGIRDALRLTAALDAAEPPRTTRSPRLSLGTWDPLGSLANVTFAGLFDLDAMPVTRAEAMAVPSVARARNTIAGTIARIPLRSFRDLSRDPAQPDRRSTGAPLWAVRTDQAVSPYHRMLWTIDDHLFYGESLWAVERGADGFPLRVERVEYERWAVDPDTAVIVVDDVPAAPGSVIHLPGPHDGILSYGARTIRAATALDRTAADVAARPFRVELHNESDLDLDDDEIADLIAQTRAGLATNGGIIYTSRGVRATLHTVAAESLLIEGRNAAAVDVARLVNVPAAALDAATDSGLSYENAQARLTELVVFGLAGYMSSVSSRLSLDDVAPAGTVIGFDVDDALRTAALAVGTNPNGDAP